MSIQIKENSAGLCHWEPDTGNLGAAPKTFSVFAESAGFCAGTQSRAAGLNWKCNAVGKSDYEGPESTYCNLSYLV